MVERLELNIGKNEWNVTNECSLATWESGSYNLRLPYSGKFSHGANFPPSLFVDLRFVLASLHNRHLMCLA